MFRFRPREEQEMDGALLPKGTYHATVLKGEAKASKAGNPMLSLLLKVWPPDGGEGRLVNDYLLDTDSAAWKLQQFCKSAGLDYDAGEIDPEQLSTGTINVRARIDVEKASGDFPAKNICRGYELHPTTPQEKELAAAAPSFAADDSDVPF